MRCVFAMMVLVGSLVAVVAFESSSASAAVPGVRAEVSSTTGSLTGTLKSVWLRKYPMIVYLERVDGTFTPPKEQPVIDQKDKMFVPHLLAELKGTTTRYVNHDDTKHNVYMIRPDGKQVNLGTGMADWSRDYVMNQAGVYVHRCNIHDEMAAYIVVMDNPYYSLIERRASREPAEFTLDAIPPGEYKLGVWCEKFYSQKGHKFNRLWDVTIEAGQETTIDLKP